MSKFNQIACHPSSKRPIAGQPFPFTKALEVLCKVQAYVVKRPRDGTERPGVAQVLWKRHGGPIKAWDEAKSRAGL